MSAKSDVLAKRLQDLRDEINGHKRSSDSISDARALLLLSDVLLTGIEAQFFDAGGGYQVGTLIAKHPKSLKSPT